MFLIFKVVLSFIVQIQVIKTIHLSFLFKREVNYPRCLYINHIVLFDHIKASNEACWQSRAKLLKKQLHNTKTHIKQLEPDYNQDTQVE